MKAARSHVENVAHVLTELKHLRANGVADPAL